MTLNQMNKRRIGTQYENCAVDYLVREGYEILDRNYSNRFGEIDIIAKNQEKIIVFFEVKYRKSNAYGDPLESVNFQKQKRISQTALYYTMMQHYGESQSYRFDVIGIYGDGKLKHVKNAFDFQF